ncbi:MAG TPA: metallophosphoesterase family protein [Planctomycetia bacterium]|nr:metallophosphoesterase family protein [Planctomycetia bacterium]
MRLFSLLFAAAFASFAPGHEPDDAKAGPAKVTPKAAHRPSPLPDRIVLTWSGDPATTQAVTWRTDVVINEAFAEIAVAGPDSSFKKDSRRVLAVTTPLDSDLGLAHYHSAEFANLVPDTTYVYRVGDGVNWSEWFQFTTAKDKPAPFSFIYFGDAQNDLKEHWSRVIRQAHRDAPKASFMLHAGDLINRANSDADWGEWFGAGGWLHGTLPSIPVTGNHEYFKLQKTDKQAFLSRHWKPQFTLPAHGPAGLEETVYRVDYQGVRFLCLNSNERHEEQTPWLEAQLKDNPCRWTIASFHHPMHSSARGRDNLKLRQLWQPLFDKYRVDLALTGHDHTYARSGLMESDNVPTGAAARAPGGTVYVVSVSGPKMYRLDREDFMRRAGEDVQLYQIISINGDKLEYEARTAVGVLYDGFTLTKKPGAANELVDRIPATPERRKPPEVKAAAAVVK